MVAIRQPAAGTFVVGRVIGNFVDSHLNNKERLVYIRSPCSTEIEKKILAAASGP